MALLFDLVTHRDDHTTAALDALGAAGVAPHRIAMYRHPDAPMPQRVPSVTATIQSVALCVFAGAALGFALGGVLDVLGMPGPVAALLGAVGGALLGLVAVDAAPSVLPDERRRALERLLPADATVIAFEAASSDELDRAREAVHAAIPELRLADGGARRRRP